jgi:diguanylate cyclase (GGDEF)-like protein
MRTEISTTTSSKPAPKVLIFDEDIAVRSLIVQGLKSSKNMRIYEVGNAHNIEQRVHNQYFDLIVVGRFSDQNLVNEIIDDSDGISKTESFVTRLKDSCECLVALYEESSEEADNKNKFSLSKNDWNVLIDTISKKAGDSSTDGYLLYPRPSRPELIPALEVLAHRTRKSRPNSHQNTNVEASLQDRQLVLWAGPSKHSLVDELQRACAAMHHHLVCVDSAQHALRETRRTRFEVCFVHTELSDMAGLSLVRSLRREVGESLPVAYVGIAQQVSDRLEGVHAGVSLYINETAGFDAVTQALRHLQNLGTHGVSRILVIDDEDSTMADVVSDELSRGKFQVSCLTSPLRILELLAEVRTDLLVIHAEMKGLGGFELCRTLRAMPEWQTLPIMLVGESHTDEVRVAAYRSGADDYISSSAEEGVIRACVEARLERSRTVQERADRDGLTGLLIRRAFNDGLLSHMALARRRGSTVAVCLIDLDHFKSINDTYGHIAGDRVLSALGRLLSSSFRVEDLRGRWGGEEFVVAFSDESADSAKAILERARKEFVRFYFDGEHGERFHAAFSAGIACYPEAGETIEDVFKVADRRLYAVKEAGRNNIFAHDPPNEEIPIEDKPNVQEGGDHVKSESQITAVVPLQRKVDYEPSDQVSEQRVDDTEDDDVRVTSPLPQLLPPFSDED